jgi:hypothetical protein
MQLLNNRVAAVGGAAALLIGLGGVGGAVAANTIGSHDIRNDSIRSVDVQNGTLGMRDLNDYTQHQIRQGGERGPAGPQGE